MFGGLFGFLALDRLALSLQAVVEMLGRDFRDELERLHHAFAFDRGCFVVRIAFQSQRFLQFVDRQNAGDVALVVLNDDRGVFGVDAVLLHVLEEIEETLAG